MYTRVASITQILLDLIYIAMESPFIGPCGQVSFAGRPLEFVCVLPGCDRGHPAITTKAVTLWIRLSANIDPPERTIKLLVALSVRLSPVTVKTAIAWSGVSKRAGSRRQPLPLAVRMRGPG
jgi:hypothetical protein